MNAQDSGSLAAAAPRARPGRIGRVVLAGFAGTAAPAVRPSFPPATAACQCTPPRIQLKGSVHPLKNAAGQPCAPPKNEGPCNVTPWPVAGSPGGAQSRISVGRRWTVHGSRHCTRLPGAVPRLRRCDGSTYRGSSGPAGAGPRGPRVRGAPQVGSEAPHEGREGGRLRKASRRKRCGRAVPRAHSWSMRRAIAPTRSARLTVLTCGADPRLRLRLRAAGRSAPMLRRRRHGHWPAICSCLQRCRTARQRPQALAAND